MTEGHQEDHHDRRAGEEIIEKELGVEENIELIYTQRHEWLRINSITSIYELL